MAKNRIEWLALALSIWVCLMFCPAQAISIGDAVEPIATETVCTLTVAYGYDGTAFSNVQVKLYKIADVSADCYFTLTAPFAESRLILNGIPSSGEWNVIRSTLDAYILAEGIQPDAVAVTDSEGKAFWENLGTGMYLAVAEEVVTDQVHCIFDSALIAVPGLETDGRWLYDVEVIAKAEALPPIEPDEEVEWKVLKLWKGDEDGKNRPQSVEVEIFRDGVSYETVLLSESNHWSYSWSAKDDGATWMAVERNVPGGYAMTMEQRENTFVVTNTLIPDNPDGPGKPPQTGDSANLLVYILLMALSGSMLIILGFAGKRKSA